MWLEWQWFRKPGLGHMMAKDIHQEIQLVPAAIDSTTLFRLATSYRLHRAHQQHGLHGGNNPYYPFIYLFIFCNNLKALFTAPSTATQWEFMRGVGGRAWTTHIVLKVSRIIEPNGKAYSTNSTRVQIRFQTQWLLEKKKKIDLIS